MLAVIEIPPHKTKTRMVGAMTKDLKPKETQSGASISETRQVTACSHLACTIPGEQPSVYV